MSDQVPASRSPLATELGDQFRRHIDDMAADFVRPGDTTEPVWVVYQEGQPLGTIAAIRQQTTGWRIQSTGERLADLDDTVRALRRPHTWHRDRAQATDWARRTLADPRTLLVDVETTGLVDPYVLQIAAIDTQGRVLIDTHVNPLAPIEEGATAVHGITAETVRGAATYAALLPQLTEALSGRHCVAYNARYDRDCLARETSRATAAGHPQAAVLWHSLTWADAMDPYAAWRGLWHASRGTYRRQKLCGPHDALADSRALLERLHTMAADRT